MKAFLRQVLAALVAQFAFAGFLALLAGALYLRAERAVGSSGGILAIDLGRGLSDRGSEPLVLRLLRGQLENPHALHRVTESLRHAAKDADVKAVLLHGSVKGGFSLLRELRLALADLRKSGKRVVAWFPAYDDDTLYLASVADDVAISPLGYARLAGLHSEALYFKDALDALGAEAQVVRAGEYKNAFEPLVSRSMSEGTRRSLEAQLGSIESLRLEEIAATRGLAAGELERLAKDGPYLGVAAAIAARLVDRALSFTELAQELEAAAGSAADGGGFRQVALEDYVQRVARARPRGRSAVVAVVFAEGLISGGAATEGRVGGEPVATALRELERDEAVRAAVLRVNSGGGEVDPSEAILEAVRRLRQTGRVVVVSMGNVAASGGYWISSAADAILAHPSTITGSIGVVDLQPNFEPLLSRLGIRREVVKTDPYADSESLLRRKSEAEIAALQALVNEVYDQFLSRVADGRGMSKAAVHEIAQGQIWTGARALELGLVDRLGTLDDAIALAAEKASLGTDYSVRYVERETPLLERVLDAFSGGASGPLARSGSLTSVLLASVESAGAATRSGSLPRVLALLPPALEGD